MNLSQGLQTIQEQKLALTPELKQSLKVLQFSQFELQAHIQEQLLENPVLERPETIDFDPLKLERRDTPASSSQPLAKDSDIPDDYRYYDKLKETPTLQDHLMGQLGCMKLSDRSKSMIATLIHNVNENGYLDMDLHELAETIKAPVEALEVSLDLLQKMDPIGVGARSLTECLTLQFKTYLEDTTLAESIIFNSLDDLANNRIKKIAKDHNASIDSVTQAISIIRKASPKPGSRFKTSNHIPYIQPDILVNWDHEQVQILINNRYTSPHLTVQDSYATLMKDRNVPEETLLYLQEKMNAATLLIKNINQRKNTIEKVASAIVAYQDHFFTEGSPSIKPMRLVDIANLVDMHESTVSRAVDGKYIQCPHGTFPLKHFFQTGLGSENGDSASATDIQQMIIDLIKNENSKKPLSDQKIADDLTDKGIQISRRTVAKYRTKLDIPSASKRKQY